MGGGTADPLTQHDEGAGTNYGLYLQVKARAELKEERRWWWTRTKDTSTESAQLEDEDNEFV